MAKIERFHRTLRTEFLMEKKFDSFESAQIQFNEFVDYYNSQRPHQGIGMAPPRKRFLVPAPVISRPIQVSDQIDTQTWVARRVGGNGAISIAWQQISVGKHRAGLDVDVLVTEGMIHIYHKDELLKTALRNNSKEVRKKNASVLKNTS